MATPQQFEGSSIEEVLAEVRRTLGSDAEILEANKVRTGGIGGFFAKESFEVLATPAPTPSAPPRPVGPALAGAPGSGLAGLLDLADRVSDAERTEAGADDDARSTSASQVAADHLADLSDMADRAGGPLDPTPAAGTAFRMPGGFEPLSADDMPRLSTEGGAFTDVLARIAADAGPEIADALDARLPAAPPAPAATAPSDPVPSDPVSSPAEEAVDRHVHDVAVRSTPSDVPAVEDRTARLLTWLERGNLPRTTLTTALRSLPTVPALPDTPGVVVAVVGRRGDALRLCKRLARDHGGDAAIVLASASYRGRAFAGPTLVGDADEAARERLGWRRRSAPTFVAVECSAAIRGDVHAWTHGVLDKLDAHRVIGVVKAATKPDDVQRWVELVGGVDGLALDALAETTTPWAVLALGLPVAYLDDDPASPAAWTEVVMGDDALAVAAGRAA